jgi:hypothetical protein
MPTLTHISLQQASDAAMVNKLSNFCSQLTKPNGSNKIILKNHHHNRKVRGVAQKTSCHDAQLRNYRKDTDLWLGQGDL